MSVEKNAKFLTECTFYKTVHEYHIDRRARVVKTPFEMHFVEKYVCCDVFAVILLTHPTSSDV
jgi:hypothetical protein